MFVRRLLAASGNGKSLTCEQTEYCDEDDEVLGRPPSVAVRACGFVVEAHDVS